MALRFSNIDCSSAVIQAVRAYSLPKCQKGRAVLKTGERQFSTDLMHGSRQTCRGGKLCAYAAMPGDKLSHPASCISITSHCCRSPHSVNIFPHTSTYSTCTPTNPDLPPRTNVNRHRHDGTAFTLPTTNTDALTNLILSRPSASCHPPPNPTTQPPPSGPLPPRACTILSARTSLSRPKHPKQRQTPTPPRPPSTLSKAGSRSGARNKTPSRWNCCDGSSASRSPSSVAWSWRLCGPGSGCRDVLHRDRVWVVGLVVCIGIFWRVGIRSWIGRMCLPATRCGIPLTSIRKWKDGLG